MEETKGDRDRVGASQRQHEIKTRQEGEGEEYAE